MANMTYARFRNTLRELRDCLADIEDHVSIEEARARTELIKLCREIADYNEDVLARYVNDDS